MMAKIKINIQDVRALNALESEAAVKNLNRNRGERPTLSSSVSFILLLRPD
jgi:hypothetical protein